MPTSSRWPLRPALGLVHRRGSGTASHWDPDLPMAPASRQGAAQKVSTGVWIRRAPSRTTTRPGEPAGPRSRSTVILVTVPSARLSFGADVEAKPRTDLVGWSQRVKNALPAPPNGSGQKRLSPSQPPQKRALRRRSRAGGGPRTRGSPTRSLTGGGPGWKLGGRQGARPSPNVHGGGGRHSRSAARRIAGERGRS